MVETAGNLDLGFAYSSSTQRARAISEGWIESNGYCLRCDSDRLNRTTANTRTRDFVCKKCSHSYELKCKCGVFTKRVLDGAYSAMLRTIRESMTPTFLLMEYSPSWCILGLRAIHHPLITEEAIEPRKPLSATARRAGWIGCNIVLPSIAIQGQIRLIDGGVALERATTRNAFARLERLSSLPPADRSWAATMLRLTERLPPQFTLQDMYAFEPELEKCFPKNKHIRPKIRQQLQVLRDAGFIMFCGGGRYERIATG